MVTVENPFALPPVAPAFQPRPFPGPETVAQSAPATKPVAVAKEYSGLQRAKTIGATLLAPTLLGLGAAKVAEPVQQAVSAAVQPVREGVEFAHDAASYYLTKDRFPAYGQPLADKPSYRTASLHSIGDGKDKQDPLIRQTPESSGLSHRAEELGINPNSIKVIQVYGLPYPSGDNRGAFPHPQTGKKYGIWAGIIAEDPKGPLKIEGQTYRMVGYTSENFVTFGAIPPNATPAR